MAIHDLGRAGRILLCPVSGSNCNTPRECTEFDCARAAERRIAAACAKSNEDKKTAIRQTVDRFADEMFAKLMKHIDKTTWRDQPIEALLKLMLLEIEEFKVADEFFTVAEARKELVDIANFALILYDRLGMIDQDQNRRTNAK